MEHKNDMRVFREEAQLSFDNACHAFSASVNMKQTGELAGIKKLRDKLNPTRDHKLSALELKLITKASGDMTLINNLLLSLNLVAVNIDRDDDDATLVKYALENSKNAGELASLALENGGEIRLPRRKTRQILDTCHAGIANLVLLANDLESRTTGVTPFLSLATDFVITNGAPGLIG